MSKALSLKLRDDVYAEAQKILKRTGKARNAYINEAVQFYNEIWNRKRLKDRLALESALVAADSLETLKAFEEFEDKLEE